VRPLFGAGRVYQATDWRDSWGMKGGNEIMKHRHSAVLAMMALVLAVAGAAVAAQGPRLEGKLAEPARAFLVQPSSVVTVPVGEGRLTVTAGTMRALKDRRQHDVVLRLEGFKLAPGARYMVVAGSHPLATFAADRSGRVNARYAAGQPRPGWKGLSSAQAARLAQPLGVVRVVPLDGTRLSPVGRALAKDEPPGYASWTPLCGNDGNPLGEVSVSDFAGYSYFNAFGSGLTPGVTYTVRANNVEVGSAAADEWGFLWVDADAGAPPDPSWPGAMFDLPDTLLPVSVITTVELVGGGQVALSGNFADPCVEPPPLPVESGSIQLCDPTTQRSTGWFDWAIFEGGLQVANLNVIGLAPGTNVDVALDGTSIASLAVGEDAMLWVTFSTDPQTGELPLPAAVLPLSQVQEVVVSSGGVTLLSGVPGQDCEWPQPVEMGSTPLCAVDGGTAAGTFGEVGWAVYDNGTEELWLFVAGVLPATEYGLAVDGVQLGSFMSDDWGSLWLGFSTDSASGLPPVPEAIRPVSGVDQVALDQGGTVVVSGSFSDPCGPPQPPVPVEQGSTMLCPSEGFDRLGSVTWAVYENGDQELWVSGWGFAPSAGVQLVVDDHDLGVFTADEWGGLNLDFSSNPQGEWQLQLPADVQPVSGVDAVALSVDGALILGGSFSQPCTPPPPPVPVQSGYTSLCAEVPGLMAGDVYWSVWDDGREELYVSTYSLSADTEYHLVVDGHDLGAFTADGWGGLFLAFSSAADSAAGQLPLPEEIRPLSGLDVVELRDGSGVTVVAGSFANPCINDVVYDGNATGLCGGDNVVYGSADWWTVARDGTVWAEGVDIMLWPPDNGATYRAVVDGVAVGALLPMDPMMGAMHLSLGTGADAPIPAELEPVSGIDQFQILAADDTVVYQGSFSNPCSDGNWGDPRPLFAWSTNQRRVFVR
jgi:hypothetical protein